MNGTTGARERAVEIGIEALGDDDLIALVLGTGKAGQSVAIVAARLLEDSGGLLGMMRLGVGGIAAQDGVGAVKAARLFAGFEMGRRALTEELRAGRFRFCDADAVERWARPRLASLEHEELWVLALDGRQGLRAARRVALGGVHGLHVSVRDVLRVAVREAASAFIAVHNHPSGDPTPSQQDVEFTARLAEAAETVGTPMLDHVVVARGGHTSLLAYGAVPEFVHLQERPLTRV
jgi:DNA repair protein RadC